MVDVALVVVIVVIVAGLLVLSWRSWPRRRRPPVAHVESKRSRT